MNRHIIFFATGRFAGMTTYAVIGIKIKAVLFIAIGVLANAGFTVNVKALISQRTAWIGQFNVLTIAVLNTAFMAMKAAVSNLRQFARISGSVVGRNAASEYTTS